jgi:outer membrane immunogenic protein
MSTPPSIMPVPLMPVYGWTGFYVGANLGGASASGSLSNNVTSESVSASHSGFIGGLQFGYNWQFGNFVLGAELLRAGSGNLHSTISGVSA